MIQKLGWLGCVLGLAVLPAACDDDGDRMSGAAGSGNTPGSGGGSATGGDSALAGSGGDAGQAALGGTSGNASTAGNGAGGTVGGRGGTAGGAESHGGSSARGGTDSGEGGAAGNVDNGGAGAGAEAGAAGQTGAGQGGEGGDDGNPLEHLEIQGTWSSNFGATEVVTDDAWSVDYGGGPSSVTVVSFSNGENYAIRQWPADDPYNPLKFDRTVWTEIDADHFYYCTVDFGLDTAEQAAASTTPFDASDPDNAGCGGFSWTKLSLL